MTIDHKNGLLTNNFYIILVILAHTGSLKCDYFLQINFIFIQIKGDIASAVTRTTCNSYTSENDIITAVTVVRVILPNQDK